jgi:hypothetical protein
LEYPILASSIVEGWVKWQSPWIFDVGETRHLTAMAHVGASTVAWSPIEVCATANLFAVPLLQVRQANAVWGAGLTIQHFGAGDYIRVVIGQVHGLGGTLQRWIDGYRYGSRRYQLE